jgi:hypothetical protein
MYHNTDRKMLVVRRKLPPFHGPSLEIHLMEVDREKSSCQIYSMLEELNLR